MDLRKILGEINGRYIIDKGDKVKIVFFEEGKKKEVEGVLIKVNEKKIKINGTIPAKEILIENILEIKKS